MKAQELQDLIDFIAKSGLDEVNIETENFKVSVKKSTGTTVAAAPAPAAALPAPAPAPAPAASAPEPAAAPAPTPAPAPASGNTVTVKSPMIGTFYRSANPEAESFVNVGDKISVGQTVCIVEAMKLFNEIESEVSGTIIKVLVDDASPVEYDQPLFLVDPA